MTVSNAVILRPGIARTRHTEPVPDRQFTSARNKAQMTPEAQVKMLRGHIHTKLRQIHQLVSHGRYDQAGKVADIVSADRARLVLLVTEIDQLPKTPEPAPILTKPKTKQVRKPKRYGRWSDK